MDRGTLWVTIHGVPKSWTQVNIAHTTLINWYRQRKRFHRISSYLMDFLVAPVVKNLPANVGDARDQGLILRPGRSPGVGNGNPLQ